MNTICGKRITFMQPLIINQRHRQSSIALMFFYYILATEMNQLKSLLCGNVACLPCLHHIYIISSQLIGHKSIFLRDCGHFHLTWPWATSKLTQGQVTSTIHMEKLPLYAVWCHTIECISLSISLRMQTNTWQARIQGGSRQIPTLIWKTSLKLIVNFNMKHTGTPSFPRAMDPDSARSDQIPYTCENNWLLDQDCSANAPQVRIVRDSLSFCLHER
jgi:hypothetical protein